MKKVAFVFLLSLLVFSCEKDEKIPSNPDWLNTMISQLENSSLPGISIYAYKWKEEYYYHVSNLISSCMFCEVYDFKGEKISWTGDKFTDFTKNGKMIKVIWQKAI